MKAMEIPFGHRGKILKKLKEFKLHRKNQSQAEITTEILNTSTQDMGVGVDDAILNDNNDKNSNTELDDEEEQHRLFRQAVEEFRKAKKQDVDETNKKITVIREVDEEVNEVI
jgi:hypothetical protein